MDPKLIEQFGLTGVFILAAWLMMRYFMGQIEKKDTRIQELTNTFMSEIARRDASLTDLTSRYSALAEKTATTIDRNLDSIEKLINDIRELQKG